jgi:D-arabinose 1-dehydrogenase-like Zn-dependent alcohol dehydrogenase
MAEPKEITDEKNGNVEDDNMMWAFAINKDTGKEGALVRVAKPSNLRPGFARIRVLRAGICNTDLELLQGYMGFSGKLKVYNIILF